MSYMDDDDDAPPATGGLFSRQVSKTLDEVTLEDVANLDMISITCDEPVRQVPDTSRLSTILDITSFKPFKPLSRREERAAKAKEEPHIPKTPSRKLPFSSRRGGRIDIKKGQSQSLRQHSLSDLEQDYYKSLMDINGKFQKYVPKVSCQGESMVIEFRMQLADGKIWRTFQMEATTNFYLLRRALLDMLGWREEVSWSFMYVSRENKVEMVGQTGPLKTDKEIRNEEQMIIVETLHESYCKFCFLYDLQQRWRIDLFLTKVLDKTQGVLLPVCVRGKGLLKFPHVDSPKKLAKVCKALKDPEDPKRKKYLEVHGDLLSVVPVTSTPFPSFYDQPQTVDIASLPQKKRKKATAEGPIIVSLEI